MVEFVEKFDFLSSVIPHIQQKDSLPIEEMNPRVVGSERNGILLYTWYRKQAKQPSAWQTLVSEYDTSSNASRVLFCHNDKVEIVNASVNQTFIILAFTIRERQVNQTKNGPEETISIFKSYIAEIAPQKRVFSLNIEWHTYQKVQFLYNSNPSTKEIHMLFIHHKESIGLYCMPVAKLGDDGFVMSSQPKTDQIARHFLWSKFDPTEQRLFFIQLRAQDEEQKEGVVIFNAIQFESKGKYRYILNFQLPCFFRMEMMREKVQYFDRNLGHCVSNMNLNIDVLATNKGTLMVCYQHQLREQAFANERGSATPTPEDDSLSVCSSLQLSHKVSYTIFCVHAAYSIHCSVSLNAEIAVKSQILFAIFGDYLMVLLPGHFLHLLDCGSEHEPVHHIYMSERDCPIPSQDTQFSTATWDFVSAVQHSVQIFDNVSQKSYRVSFNFKNLIKIFSTAHHASMRMAILHAAVVHIKDVSFSKKLIECLCQDPANLECSDLVQEYLIATSYAHMKQQLNLARLRPFPFTCLDVFRGQVEKDRENKTLVFLTYKKFTRDLADVLLYLLKGKDTEYWVALKETLKFSQDQNLRRLPVKNLSLIRAAQQNLGSTAGQDFKLRQGSAASSGEGGRMSSDQAKKEGGRRPKSEESKSGDESLSMFVIEHVTGHFVKCFPRENKNKVQNICAEYAFCRGKVVKSFWRHLTKVLGYAQENEVFKQPLEKTSKITDFALFQMLERLYFSVEQLCFPPFRGMQNIFVALGYRCLPNHLFKQYFRASVFKASPEFVARFVAEVPDDDQTSSLKLHLISRLHRRDAKPIIYSWDHPVAKRYRIQEIVGKVDNSSAVNAGSAMMADSVSGGREADRYLPTETFLRSIGLEENSRNFASFQITDEEWKFLIDNALENSGKSDWNTEIFH